MIIIHDSKNMHLTLIVIKDVVLSLLLIRMCACQCDCVVYNSLEEKKKKVFVCVIFFSVRVIHLQREKGSQSVVYFFCFFVCVIVGIERERERDQWLRGNNGREKERYPLCAGKSRREQKKSLVQTSGCFQRTSQLYYYHSLLKKQKQMAWAAACVRVGKHSSPSLLPLYSNQNSMPLLKPPLLFSPHL